MFELEIISVQHTVVLKGFHSLNTITSCGKYLFFLIPVQTNFTCIIGLECHLIFIII